MRSRRNVRDLGGGRFPDVADMVMAIFYAGSTLARENQEAKRRGLALATANPDHISPTKQL